MMRCPHCNVPLTSDEERGSNCPACGGSISTAISAKESRHREIHPEAVAEEPYRETYRETYRERMPEGTPLLGWASVRTTFTLFVTGWILIHASTLITLLVEEGSRVARNPPGGLLYLMAFISFAIVAGAVQCVTSMCMALAVPAESRARGWGIGILVSLVLSLGAFLVLTGSRFGMEPGLAKALAYVCVGGVFLSKLLYTGFVQALARQFRLPGVAIATLIYLVLELALFTWYFIGVVRNDPRHAGPLDDILGGPGAPENRWIVTIVSVAMCGWFVSMVLVVRSAITRSLLRR